MNALERTLKLRDFLAALPNRKIVVDIVQCDPGASGLYAVLLSERLRQRPEVNAFLEEASDKLRSIIEDSVHQEISALRTETARDLNKLAERALYGS